MAAFTAQLPNIMTQIGGSLVQTAGQTGINASSRATITLGNKPFIQRKATGKQSLAPPSRNWSRASDPHATATADFGTTSEFFVPSQWGRAVQHNDFQVTQFTESGRLPLFLQKLVDPDASADFPPAHRVDVKSLDNRELDKLVAALGRNNLTWRRALQLHEWLLGLGHTPDDRLCTTLMRVCSQHSHTLEALNLYSWMRTPRRQGGAGLKPSVYTYTGAMRAALVGNLPDRALQIWDDAMKAKCPIDCRMCTTLIEVCTRKGHTDRALSMYEMMRDSAPNSRMAPTVHAYTAAMRAAAEGGKWQRALQIWKDMQNAGCTPSAHAYAAAISACAAGGQWEEAISMFDEMLYRGINPDVVSCTALITALAADGQWERAESVVEWMHSKGVKPNVRTYTALVTAMGNDRQWARALSTIKSMKHSEGWNGSVEPNAYTYSALLKAMGEQGEWQMAEKLFTALEQEAVGALQIEDTGVRLGQTINGETSVSGSEFLSASDLRLGKLCLADRTASSHSLSSVGSLEFGRVPTAIAEEVLKNSSPKQISPKAARKSSSKQAPGATGSPFSFFAQRQPALNASDVFSNIWTHANAAVSGFPGTVFSPPTQPVVSQIVSTERGSAAEESSARGQGRSPYLNEVVCGAMMLAYERSGCCQQALDLLQRVKRLGIEPNTIMYNTAISALGKAGCWEAAEQLFNEIPKPDTVSFETMIAAYGLAGQTRDCEHLFSAMLESGHIPRDYAFCGLIAAYSKDGDWKSALQVRQRMKALGCSTSVHVFNALIAVCERANKLDQALTLNRAMQTEGVQPDSVTQRLMNSIGRTGVSAVEEQQIAAAALAAAVAAAGSIIIRAGII